MENKIVVLGGGTAGWFSALFAKKFISNNVTLIESVDYRDRDWETMH